MIGLDIELKPEDSSADDVIVNRGADRSQVGLDGCSRTAELRPRPEDDPLDLAQNVTKLVKRLRRYNRNWVTGAMQDGASLGGHIHISGETFGPAARTNLPKLYDIVDSLIDEDLTEERESAGYGDRTDFRRQFHGGIEYRGLPSFLFGEKMVEGILCAAHCLSSNPDEVRNVEETKEFKKYEEQITVLLDASRLGDEANTSVNENYNFKMLPYYYATTKLFKYEVSGLGCAIGKLIAKRELGTLAKKRKKLVTGKGDKGNIINEVMNFIHTGYERIGWIGFKDIERWGGNDRDYDISFPLFYHNIENLKRLYPQVRIISRRGSKINITRRFRTARKLPLLMSVLTSAMVQSGYMEKKRIKQLIETTV